jgi:hypothetical protein
MGRGHADMERERMSVAADRVSAAARKGYRRPLRKY